MGYNAKADKKYNENCKRITMKFVPSELDFYNQIVDYCNNNDMSKQEFIKTAIREKLGIESL